MKAAIRALALAVVVVVPKIADACGVSAGGAPGLCSVEDHAAELRKWRLGAGYTFTTTRIQFSNNTELPQERNAAIVTLDKQIDDRRVFQIAMGTFLIGNTGTQRMNPGTLVAASLAWRVLDQKDFGYPFILMTMTLASLTGSSQRPDGGHQGYAAFDFRYGIVVGTRIPLGRAALLPYGVVRLFGGPIFWKIDGKDVLGTDAYKHQLGGGATVTFDRFDIFIEAIGVGERSMAAGVGVSF